MPSNVHDFRFNLPLLPEQGSFPNKLGQKVEAAIEMEMRADAAINMSISSMVKLIVDDFDKRLAAKLVALYDEAHQDVLRELAFDGLDIFTQPQAKSRVMMKLLELLVDLSHEEPQP